MKRIAMASLGIAAVTALALPTAVRTVSAVTEHVCTTNSTPNTCPSGNLYGTDIFSGDTLKGNLASSNAHLSTSAGTITCTDSEYTAQSKSDGSNAQINSLEFDNGTPTTACTTNILFNPTATVKSNNLPWNATITRGAACVGGKTGCDGTIQFQNINATITLSGGSSCTVTGSPTGNFYNKGNANAPVGGANASFGELDFPGVSLTVSGNFPCPTSGTETATYYIWGVNPANTVVYVTP